MQLFSYLKCNESKNTFSLKQDISEHRNKKHISKNKKHIQKRLVFPSFYDFAFIKRFICWEHILVALCDYIIILKHFYIKKNSLINKIPTFFLNLKFLYKLANNMRFS